MKHDDLRVSEWVEEQLPSEGNAARDDKAIHDPILGTNLFRPHEFLLIDTPLFQRLRYISQTGLVYLTFPGARHSRFEHTLGTMVLVDRYVEALRKRGASISGTDHLELRLAALMHDVGHSFFSHQSEDIYKHLPEFEGYKKRLNTTKGCGELLSHAIVTSEPFERFFERVKKAARRDLNLDRIAGYILGRAANPERQFLAEIISGPFDVDKLEYIHRDAHGTGLKLVVDLERLFYSVKTGWIKRQDRDGTVECRQRIVLQTPEPLEQLVFSKIMLFATVYHHHKVKSCDSILQAAVRWAAREGQGTLSRLDTPADFLRLTEVEVLADGANPLIRRLRHRDLLYRAAVLVRETARDGWELALHELQRDTADPKKAEALTDAIYDSMSEASRRRCLREEVAVSFPEPPRLKEIELAYIQRGTDEFVPVQEGIVPTRGWLAAYETFKSKGYVFAPRDVAWDAYRACKEVLHDKYGLVLDDEAMKSMCHWATA